MKNKALMLKLLNEKNDLSFKEIAKRTGYHEKSLIRINKMIKNNQYKFKTLALEEKDYITKLYTKTNIKNITKFYNFYLKDNKLYPKRSYSTIQKIIKQRVKQNNTNYIIIGNIADKDSFERYFFALDYDSGEIIYLEKGYKDTCKIYFMIVKYIQKNYKNKTIVFKGNSFLKNKNGITYKSFINYLIKNNISYILNNIYLSKNIINKIMSTENTKINSRENILRELFSERIVVSEEDRKVFRNNIVEYKNAGYKIISKHNQEGKATTIILYLFNKKPYAKIGNKVYTLSKVYNKESKKKYT